MPGGSSIESLLDILELIERIQQQIRDVPEAEFLGDVDVQDATAYRLLAIGEAAKGIDDGIKERNPHIPWQQIIGMRNILAHEYFVRESRIIWQTVRLGLPPLVEVCRAELTALGWRPASG